MGGGCTYPQEISPEHLPRPPTFYSCFGGRVPKLEGRRTAAKTGPKTPPAPRELGEPRPSFGHPLRRRAQSRNGHVRELRDRGGLSRNSSRRRGRREARAAEAARPSRVGGRGFIVGGRGFIVGPSAAMARGAGGRPKRAQRPNAQDAACNACAMTTTAVAWRATPPDDGTPMEPFAIGAGFAPASTAGALASAFAMRTKPAHAPSTLKRTIEVQTSDCVPPPKSSCGRSVALLKQMPQTHGSVKPFCRRCDLPSSARSPSSLCSARGASAQSL